MPKKISIPSKSIGKTDEPDSLITDKLPDNVREERSYCVYEGEKYAQGAHVCHEGWIYQCTQHGIWMKRNIECLSEEEEEE